MGWKGRPKIINTGGGGATIDDSVATTEAVWSASKTSGELTKVSTTISGVSKDIEVLEEKKDHRVTYTYNANGDIATATYTGGIVKTITYTYYATGDYVGEIETETTVIGNETTVKTFVYEKDANNESRIGYIDTVTTTT